MVTKARERQIQDKDMITRQGKDKDETKIWSQKDMHGTEARERQIQDKDMITRQGKDK